MFLFAVARLRVFDTKVAPVLVLLETDEAHLGSLWTWHRTLQRVHELVLVITAFEIGRPKVSSGML